MHSDILIQHVNLFQGPQDASLAIQNGTIQKVFSSQDILPEGFTADTVIDGAGRLLIPAFVDSHTHLDKTFVNEKEAVNLLDAIEIFAEYQKKTPKAQIKKDMKKRAGKTLDMAIKNGTGTIKTNILARDAWGLEPLHAINELKEEYQDKITILNIMEYWPSLDRELRQAMKQGEVDFIAGYPTLSDDYRNDVDFIFDLALTYGLPVDLHVDESDEPNIDCFLYVLEKTIKNHMEGRVTCGHVTALNAVEDSLAKEAIAMAKEANVNITTLPSCNMFLMGRQDKEPVRRGVTRIREFLDAGVNISYASDNIRDPFRPFGNADMLEEALFCAQVIQYGTSDQLSKVLSMGTFHPAKNALLSDYGLEEGCQADLVLLDAPTPKEAIISQAAKLCYIKKGKIIFRHY